MLPGFSFHHFYLEVNPAMETALTTINHTFSPSFDTFARLIRLEAYPEAEKEAAELFEAAKELLQPIAVLKTSFIDTHNTNGELTRITADGIIMEGKVLSELNAVHRMFPYVISCGNGMESFNLASMDFLAPYWLDTLKTMALGSARLQTVTWIKEQYGIKTLSSVNPGSGNVDIWPVQQLRQIFKLLGGEDAILAQCGVRLTGSSLMIPNKTVSGLFYESDKTFTSCRYCERENCPGRKEPFSGTRL